MAENERIHEDGPVTAHVRATWARQCWYPGGCVLLVLGPATLFLGNMHGWWLPETPVQWIAVTVSVYGFVTGAVFAHAWATLPARLAAAVRADRALAELEAALTHCPVCAGARIVWGPESFPSATAARGPRCPACGIRWAAQWGEPAERSAVIALLDPGLAMSPELAATLPASTSWDEWLAWFGHRRDRATRA